MWAGPVERWIAALERLLDLGAERFLPGHGPVCGPDEVRRLLDYWRWLDRAARQRLDAGSPPPRQRARSSSARRSVELGFADWLAPERALVNVATSTRTAAAPPLRPGRGDLVPAFFRMALLARDHAMTRIELETRFDVSLREGFDYITDPANWPGTGPASFGSSPARAGASPATRRASCCGCSAGRSSWR